MLTIRITYAESMAKYFDKVLILDLSIITICVFYRCSFIKLITKPIFQVYIRMATSQQSFDYPYLQSSLFRKHRNIPICQNICIF